MMEQAVARRALRQPRRPRRFTRTRERAGSLTSRRHRRSRRRARTARTDSGPGARRREQVCEDDGGRRHGPVPALGLRRPELGPPPRRREELPVDSHGAAEEVDAVDGSHLVALADSEPAVHVRPAFANRASAAYGEVMAVKDKAVDQLRSKHKEGTHHGRHQLQPHRRPSP